jgi:hypothetical protein
VSRKETQLDQECGRLAQEVKLLREKESSLRDENKNL